jgi:Tyrosine phosphatase family
MTTEATPDLTSLLSQSVIHPLPPSQVEFHLSKPPFIPLLGVMNLRTLTSPTLPPDRIYRSGALTHVPAPTLSLLPTTYNIRTIYDLRSAPEREKAPSPVIGGVETVWIPNTADGTVYLKDENGEQRKKEVPRDVPTGLFAEGDGVEAWMRKYRNILDMHGHIYKAVFEKLRDGGEGAVLFHCTGLCSLLNPLNFYSTYIFSLSPDEVPLPLRS